MYQRRNPWPVLLPVMLLTLAAFLSGALLERLGWLPGAPVQPPLEVGRAFDPFWESWRLVDRYYVDRKAVDPEHMTQGAIEGMLASLGDVGHTTYLSHEELQQLENSIEGNFEGIGCRMTVRKQQPTVVQTMPGSPARKDGLKPGDILLEVNGKPVSGLPLKRVAEMVRGPLGTKVKLHVARGSKVLDFEITREKVDVPAVTWHMLPGTHVAHVALQEFGKHADGELDRALKEARGQGVEGLLVDVRGNPGGLKEQAVAVTSEFLKGGNVFIEQDAEGRRTPVPVKPGGDATDLPLLVLIDEGTASSAEIFAGAIQDHGRGKLVGTKTFGTGTVLRPFGLSDGGAVLLAVDQWLTPNGRQIWHKGISPDVDVPLPAGAIMLLPETEADLTPAGLAASKDSQLLRGLDLLQQQIQSGAAPAVSRAK